MFENPALAQQQALYQLQAEQQQFWYPFNARPPSNDAERQQAISALMQRYGQLSVLQGDAMFLNSQGYGQLLTAINSELGAIQARRDQYVAALQAPYYPPPSAPAPPPVPSAPSPSPRGQDVLAWLDRSSQEQDAARRRMVGDCIYCGLPTEGFARCPHCGRYQ
jgi:hypothetical protein